MKAKADTPHIRHGAHAHHEASYPIENFLSVTPRAQRMRAHQPGASRTNKFEGTVRKMLDVFHTDAYRRPSSDSPIQPPSFGGVHPGRSMSVESEPIISDLGGEMGDDGEMDGDGEEVILIAIATDDESSDPNILKAELDILSTPHSIDYSDIVVQSLQNVQEQCYVDYESLCAPQPEVMIPGMIMEDMPGPLMEVVSPLLKKFGSLFGGTVGDEASDETDIQPVAEEEAEQAESAQSVDYLEVMKRQLIGTYHRMESPSQRSAAKPAGFIPKDQAVHLPPAQAKEAAALEHPPKAGALHHPSGKATAHHAPGESAAGIKKETPLHKGMIHKKPNADMHQLPGAEGAKKAGGAHHVLPDAAFGPYSGAPLNKQLAPKVRGGHAPLRHHAPAANHVPRVARKMREVNMEDRPWERDHDRDHGRPRGRHGDISSSSEREDSFHDFHHHRHHDRYSHHRDEDVSYQGSIGYGAEGDQCMYANLNLVSDGCRAAITQVYEVRSAYFEEEEQKHHHGGGGFFVLLLLILCCVRLYRNHFSSQAKHEKQVIKQATEVLDMINASQPLKASVESSYGAQLPILSDLKTINVAPFSASSCCKRFCCIAGGFFMFIFMLNIAGAIVGGMLSGLVQDSDDADEGNRAPPKLLALFLFIVVFLMEVFAVVMVGKAIRKCRQPNAEEAEARTGSSTWNYPSFPSMFQSNAAPTFASTGVSSNHTAEVNQYNRMDTSSSTPQVNVWGKSFATNSGYSAVPSTSLSYRSEETEMTSFAPSTLPSSNWSTHSPPIRGVQQATSSSSVYSGIPITTRPAYAPVK